MHPVERISTVKEIAKRISNVEVTDRGTFSYSIMSIPAREIYAAAYNRGISKSHVKDIVKHFNPNLVNYCKVSFRDGRYWIFDGNHTLRALIEVAGGNEDILVECKVYEGMTYEDEAYLFSLQFGNARKVSVSQVLKARCEAKDRDALLFKAAVERAGAIVSFSPGRYKGHLNCLDLAFKIYSKLGEDHLYLVIASIMKIWNGDPDSMLKEIVGGMSIFFSTYPYASLDRLSKALRKDSPAQIISNGKTDEFHTGYARYAAQIAKRYNTKLSSSKQLDLSLLAK